MKISSDDGMVRIPDNEWFVLESLRMSPRGDYLLEHRAQEGGEMPYCRVMTREEAAQWLTDHKFILPPDLRKFRKLDEN